MVAAAALVVIGVGLGDGVAALFIIPKEDKPWFTIRPVVVVVVGMISCCWWSREDKFKPNKPAVVVVFELLVSDT